MKSSIFTFTVATLLMFSPLILSATVPIIMGGSPTSTGGSYFKQIYMKNNIIHACGYTNDQALITGSSYVPFFTIVLSSGVIQHEKYLTSATVTLQSCQALQRLSGNNVILLLGDTITNSFLPCFVMVDSSTGVLSQTNKGTVPLYNFRPTNIVIQLFQLFLGASYKSGSNYYFSIYSFSFPFNNFGTSQLTWNTKFMDLQGQTTVFIADSSQINFFVGGSQIIDSTTNQMIVSLVNTSTGLPFWTQGMKVSGKKLYVDALAPLSPAAGNKLLYGCYSGSGVSSVLGVFIFNMASSTYAVLSTQNYVDDNPDNQNMQCMAVSPSTDGLSLYILLTKPSSNLVFYATAVFSASQITYQALPPISTSGATVTHALFFSSKAYYVGFITSIIENQGTEIFKTTASSPYMGFIMSQTQSICCINSVGSSIAYNLNLDTLNLIRQVTPTLSTTITGTQLQSSSSLNTFSVSSIKSYTWCTTYVIPSTIGAILLDRSQLPATSTFTAFSYYPSVTGVSIQYSASIIPNTCSLTFSNQAVPTFTVSNNCPESSTPYTVTITGSVTVSGQTYTNSTSLNMTITCTPAPTVTAPLINSLNYVIATGDLSFIIPSFTLNTICLVTYTLSMSTSTLPSYITVLDSSSANYTLNINTALSSNAGLISITYFGTASPSAVSSSVVQTITLCTYPVISPISIPDHSYGVGSTMGSISFANLFTVSSSCTSTSTFSFTQNSIPTVVTSSASAIEFYTASNLDLGTYQIDFTYTLSVLGVSVSCNNSFNLLINSDILQIFTTNLTPWPTYIRGDLILTVTIPAFTYTSTSNLVYTFTYSGSLTGASSMPLFTNTLSTFPNFVFTVLTSSFSDVNTYNISITGTADGTFHSATYTFNLTVVCGLDQTTISVNPTTSQPDIIFPLMSSTLLLDFANFFLVTSACSNTYPLVFSVTIDGFGSSYASFANSVLSLGSQTDPGVIGTHTVVIIGTITLQDLSTSSNSFQFMFDVTACIDAPTINASPDSQGYFIYGDSPHQYTIGTFSQTSTCAQTYLISYSLQGMPSCVDWAPISSVGTSIISIVSVTQQCSGQYQVSLTGFLNGRSESDSCNFNLIIDNPQIVIEEIPPVVYMFQANKMIIDVSTYISVQSPCQCNQSYPLTLSGFFNKSNVATQVEGIVFDTLDGLLSISVHNTTSCGPHLFQLSGTINAQNFQQTVSKTFQVYVLDDITVIPSQNLEFTYTIGSLNPLTIKIGSFSYFSQCSSSYVFSYHQTWQGASPPTFITHQSELMLHIDTQDASNQGGYVIQTIGSIIDAYGIGHSSIQQVNLTVICPNPTLTAPSLKNISYIVGTGPQVTQILKFTYTSPCDQNKNLNYSTYTYQNGSLPYFIEISDSLEMTVNASQNTQVGEYTIFLKSDIRDMSIVRQFMLSVLASQNSNVNNSSANDSAKNNSSYNQNSSNNLDFIVNLKADKSKVKKNYNPQKIPSFTIMSLIGWIHSLSMDGLVTVLFSQPIIVPLNYTSFDGSILCVNIQNYQNLTANFTWKVIKMKPTSMNIQLNFSDPLYISQNNMNELLAIVIIEPKYFIALGNKSLQIEKYLLMEKSLPKQIKNDGKYSYLTEQDHLNTLHKQERLFNMESKEYQLPASSSIWLCNLQLQYFIGQHL